jgi:acetyl-CoA synthetase
MVALYPVLTEWAEKARITEQGYQESYAASIKDPDAFWTKEAQRITWIKPFTKVKNTSFHEADFGIKWFEDGVLNVSENCLDRHLKDRGDQVAIIWEGDEPTQSRKITYRDLYRDVCRFANVLKNLGVKKGDRITLYLPMIPDPP